MSLKRQRGSALVMAVFVITVMMLLGLVLVNTLEQEDLNQGIEVTGTRTLAAAQSGIDWALARTLSRTAGEAGATACASANVTLTTGNGLPDIAAFNLCQVVIQCNHSVANSSDSAENRFEVTARAQCGADSVRVTRSMEALAYD